MTKEQKAFLSEKHNVSEEVITFLINYQFQFVREQLRLKRNVLLHNFGSFKINRKKIKYLLKRAISDYKNNKINRETLILKFDKLWKLRNGI